MQAVSPIVTKHKTSANKKYYIDKHLKTASRVFLKNMSKKALDPNYSGPFQVISHHDKYLTIRRDTGRTDHVSVDNVKACYNQEEILHAAASINPKFRSPAPDYVTHQIISTPLTTSAASTSNFQPMEALDIPTTIAYSRSRLTTQTQTSGTLTPTSTSAPQYTTARGRIIRPPLRLID